MSLPNQCVQVDFGSGQVIPNVSSECVDVKFNVQGRDALLEATVPVESVAVNGLSQGDMVCSDATCMSSVSNVSLCLLETDRQVEPLGQRFADEVGDFPERSDLIELVGLRKG